MQRWTAVPAEHDEAAARHWIEGEPERRQRGVALDMVVSDPDAPDGVLGEVGLGPIQWDRGRAMLGFWTAAEHRRQGIGGEAVGLMVDWAFEHTALDQVVAETARANDPSGKVLASTGFSLVFEQGPRLVWTRQA